MNLHLGHTQLILDECRKHKVLRNQAAYILATAYWETGQTMQPVREAFGKSTADSIRRLDRAWAKGQLKWVRSPYWREGFFGRGFVQLTHKYNYVKAGKKLNHDFVSRPDDVMIPENAATILVRGMMEGWFTGKKLPRYVSLKVSDYKNARRVVNGLDRSTEIARLARRYEEQLKEIGYD